MEEIVWLQLPEITWEQVFGYLDFKSLLNATEICQHFAQIFSRSSKLLDKVRIVFDTADDLDERLDVFKQSDRLYRNMLLKSPWRYKNNYDGVFIPIEPKSMSSLKESFGDKIVDLKLEHVATMLNLIELLTSFKNVKRLSFEKVSPRDTDEYTISEEKRVAMSNNKFPKLEELIFSCHTSLFCFDVFKEQQNIRKLHMYDMYYNFERSDKKNFEQFLLKQKDLKELTLLKFRDYFLFETNALDSPPFQLERLELHGVYWKNKEDPIAFFRSQRSLRTFKLALKNRYFINYDELLWFNDILKHVFTHNHNLQCISISTREKYGYNIRSCEFLEGIVCPGVVNLEYVKGHEDETSAFMECFSKMFPNIKNLSLSGELLEINLAVISSWLHLETLELQCEPKLLRAVQVNSKKLVRLGCRITMYENVRELPQFLHSFLSRHQTVRHFSLDCSDFFAVPSQSLSERIGNAIAEALPELQILRVYSRSIKPRVVKLICWKAQKLQLLTLIAQTSHREKIREICAKHKVTVIFIAEQDS